MHASVAELLSAWRWELLLVAAVSAALFGLKAALFLLRPVARVRLEGLAAAVFYPFFFYTVPETLPALLVGASICGLPLHAPFAAAARAARALAACRCCRTRRRRSGP